MAPSEKIEQHDFFAVRLKAHFLASFRCTQ